MQLAPSQSEIQSNIIPQKIGIIGSAYERNIKLLSKKITVKVLPALRFEHLWKNSKFNISKDFILVALPMLILESIEILEMIIKVNEINKININFYFKSHPTVNKNLYLDKYKLPNNFYFSDENTDKLTHNSNMIISGISSICMESICLGIPTIIIESNRNIIFNPIPKEINNIFYKKVNNSIDLSKAIKYYLNLAKRQKVLLRDPVNKNFYFENLH